MPVETNIIRYRYDLGGQQMDFEIDTSEADEVTPVDMAGEGLPDWTRLDHQQCACCPLKGG